MTLDIASALAAATLMLSLSKHENGGAPPFSPFDKLRTRFGIAARKRLYHRSLSMKFGIKPAPCNGIDLLGSCWPGVVIWLS